MTLASVRIRARRNSLVERLFAPTPVLQHARAYLAGGSQVFRCAGLIQTADCSSTSANSISRSSGIDDRAIAGASAAAAAARLQRRNASSVAEYFVSSAVSFNAIFAQQQFSLDLIVTHDACSAELDLVELVRGVVSRGRAPLVAWSDGPSSAIRRFVVQ